jgi:diaminohydroxyphosphoribosylaminopyrimidine deaminase/5-amino-6-(5-phosphoribosylamino)uracil reductase
LLAELGRRSVHELLIEGGSVVATSAIQAGVVNALTIFYSPCLIGGDGVPMVGTLGVLRPLGAVRLIREKCEVSGNDLVWTGRFC